MSPSTICQLLPGSTTTSVCSPGYASTSFNSVFSSATGDTGYTIALVVAAAVTGMIALMGLGYGIRHLKKLTGRKF